MSTTTRTPAIFDTFVRRNDFLGFGYIGSRRNALEEGWDVSTADALALEMGARLTDDKLFAWANSKDGRWFADLMFGSTSADDHEMARRYGPRGKR
jgi:hypothetical protein